MRAAHGGMGGTRPWSGQRNRTWHVGKAHRRPRSTHACHASAGWPHREQRWRAETYVARIFTTCAVSQSARLLLKSEAPSNKDSVVFARDTSHLPTARREREEIARGVANRARAGGPQHQPPRLLIVPQRAAAWPHFVCAAAWLSRSRRPWPRRSWHSRKPCLAALLVASCTVTTTKAGRAKKGRTR